MNGILRLAVLAILVAVISAASAGERISAEAWRDVKTCDVATLKEVEALQLQRVGGYDSITGAKIRVM